mmetsp:Transcript_9573/g.26836  ORF Transcript_9573/g.26836 Transcript_9573/m.26836 type:complete len:285 (+) Transcript_9573:154-1008(+)
MPGVKRSRFIWDEARREDAPWTATARAILYELQPIRFSSIDVSGVVSSLSRFGRFVAALICSIARSLPSVVRGLIRIARGMSVRQWGMVGIAVGYYYFVRLVHRTLEAGPLVVIATAMIGIFTIGLGDGDSAGMSAYSVFNRGFQQLLGSVDVEALVQQYAGGGLAVQAQMNAVDHDGVDEQNDARAARRRGNNDPAPPPPVAAAAVNDDGDDDIEPPQDGQNNRARRPNKKNRNRDRRQRNTDVRREMEQQRQAAAAMGFMGEGEQDVVAMNRLIADQVREED